MRIFLEDIAEGRYALTASGKNHLHYSSRWQSNLGQDSLGYIEITENSQGLISAHFESQLIHSSSGKAEYISGEIIDLEISEEDDFMEGFAHGKINNEAISFFNVSLRKTTGHNVFIVERQKNHLLFLYIDETMRQLGSYAFTDSLALAMDNRPWLEYQNFPRPLYNGGFGKTELEIIEYHHEAGYFVAEINGTMGSWTSQDSVTFEDFRMELPL